MQTAEIVEKVPVSFAISAEIDQQSPAVAAAPVLLDLVRTPAGWRVHDVRAA